MLVLAGLVIGPIYLAWPNLFSVIFLAVLRGNLLAEASASSALDSTFVYAADSAVASASSLVAFMDSSDATSVSRRSSAISAGVLIILDILTS